MDDADPVCFFKYIANLRRDFNRAMWRKSPFARECLRKSFAFDEFHDDELATIRQATCVEDHRRMWVAKLGHRSCFAQEPIGNIAIRSEFAFDDLYSNRSFEPEVRGEVDSAHATRADFTFNPESTGYELRDIHI
jgi:hypothetical protein